MKRFAAKEAGSRKRVRERRGLKQKWAEANRRARTERYEKTKGGKNGRSRTKRVETEKEEQVGVRERRGSKRTRGEQTGGRECRGLG